MCSSPIGGTFRWSGGKDLRLLREVRYVEPYQFKHGTKESGQAWNEVANGVNKHEGFKAMPRDQRSVGDRFNKLLADFKAKMRKEEGESGTNPEPLSEAETILEKKLRKTFCQQRLTWLQLQQKTANSRKMKERRLWP
ncbi:hypothetical protein ACROYT_G014924 [Oculina patagonica]